MSTPDWSSPTLAQAHAGARELAHLNAFISLTEEVGEGPVVAVKDLVDVKGTVTTGGGTILPQESAAEDAPFLRRLREHGCVIVGKTNLHEWAFGATSTNPHYGDVLNPHDPTRVAGGSSGGSAVAVATGMCAFAIGTDTGGSIRIPASMCGVVGFKPTFGSISTDGVIPLAKSLDTVGPLAPDVASAAFALELLSGVEILPRRPIADLGELRIGVPRDWVARIDDETEIDEQTASAWSRFGATFPELDFPDRQRVYEPSLTVLLYEAADYHREWVERFPERYASDVLGHLRRGLSVPKDEYRAALAALEPLRAEVEVAMDGWDAILLPTTAWVAPTPETKNVRAALTGFTRPFNTTGHPVITLPAPVDGLPVGLQLVGHFGEDAALARAGLALERALADAEVPAVTLP
jgi:aspartyl-tRNA(Asn)/glutamyl-tRNA(Gln) amidotransferase subunit A